jgi:hypothetical protein
MSVLILYFWAENFESSNSAAFWSIAIDLELVDEFVIVRVEYFLCWKVDSYFKFKALNLHFLCAANGRK